VRHEDHGHALPGEPADQIEDLLGLGDAVRGGRLVRDDDLRLPEHRLGDRHGLALAAGQARHELSYRSDRPHRQRRQRLLRQPLHRVLVERAQPGDLLAAEEHVLDDVEVVAESEILVHDLDPEQRGVPWPVHAPGRTVDDQLALVDAIDAADAFHQRRLSCPVVANEGGHLPRVRGDVHGRQHMDRTERFVDAPQIQRGNGGHGRITCSGGCGVGADPAQPHGSMQGHGALMPLAVHSVTSAAVGQTAAAVT
jgi:hypothetical protein